MNRPVDEPMDSPEPEDPWSAPDFAPDTSKGFPVELAARYTYAIARKGSPETLTIWHNGRAILHSLANTGIPVAPTASGTFPVYLRYRYQVLRARTRTGATTPIL